MAYVPIHTPANEVDTAESIAFSKMMESFVDMVRSRITEKLAANELIEWYNPDQLSAFVSQFETICAKPSKDRIDVLNIASLAAIILNFVDDGG